MELSRKLVDQFDLSYTLTSLQQILGQQALSFFGEGVLVTTLYPSPFVISMDSGDLGGQVGNGIAYDAQGNLTQIDPSSITANTFTISPADPTNPRWDLLVIDYVQTGTTPVPKPSDPITTIDLNLVDDFALIVRPGIASATPAYPAKMTNDIILAGLKVPAGATLGTSVTVDLSVRELAERNAASLPIFKQESLPGANGTNVSFTMSELPISSQSIIVWVDAGFVDQTQYSVSGQIITFNSAPAVGVDVEVFYVVNSPMSENPLAGTTQHLGPGNGVKTNFPVTGVPADQASTLVFVDGGMVTPDQWSLLSSSGGSAIVFNSAPAVGQSVDVFYFVSAASVGVGVNTSGVSGAANEGIGTGGVGLFDTLVGGILKFLSPKAGSNMTIAADGMGHVVFSALGGGYSRTTFGSLSSPQAIDPAVGIPATSDMDQTWWVVPNVSGPQVITAADQITPGTTVGQRLTLKGASGSNYLIIDTGTAVSQNGVCNLTNIQSITYEWDGVNWAEDSRRV